MDVQPYWALTGVAASANESVINRGPYVIVCAEARVAKCRRRRVRGRLSKSRQVRLPIKTLATWLPGIVAALATCLRNMHQLYS